MKDRIPQETSIGTFRWGGMHTKWVCDQSSLDGGLAISIDNKEITPEQIENIVEIASMRGEIFEPAMECAKKELKQHKIAPNAMTLSGIVISDELYPEGFLLVFDYPDDVWPDGQLSVVFRKGKPQYCHSDD